LKYFQKKKITSKTLNNQ